MLLDILVLVKIALGGTTSIRRISAKSRLLMYVLETAFLDSTSLVEVEALLRSAMTTDPGVDIAAIQDTLLSYKSIVLYRDRIDGSLRGMAVLDEMPREFRGQDIVQMRSGLWVVQREYRGGVLPYIFYLSRFLAAFIRHPGKPIYFLVKLFSYKTYLVAMRSSSEAYPRYDQETPAFEQALMDEYGYASETPQRQYNDKTGVLESTAVRLEEHAAPITDDELCDPHIAYFADKNPKWSEGHCLVTVLKITPNSLLRILWRIVQRKTSVPKKRRMNQHVPRNLKLLKMISVTDFLGKSSQDVGDVPESKGVSTVGDEALFDKYL